MRYVLGVVALIAAGGPLLAPARGGEPTEREFLQKLEAQVRRAVQAAEPAIACIVVSRSELYPKPPKPEDVPGKLGGFDRAEFLKANTSVEARPLADRLDLADPGGIADRATVGGVVIDPAGLVLTPYHAIEGATKLYIWLPRKAGGAVGSYADIHAADARSDLAVLKLINPPEGLKAIAFADVKTEGPKATVFPGKLVGLMANVPAPGFAPGRASFWYGAIASVRHRFGQVGDPSVKNSLYLYGQFLEYHLRRREEGAARRNLVDDRAPEAITGAALINLDGELIGLTSTTAIAYNRPIGPGYAIPMDGNTRRIVDVLKRGEEVEYGFLGVTLGDQKNGFPGAPKQPINAVIIGDVMKHSPADVAGLTNHYVITAIDGLKAENYQDLLFFAGNALAGTTIKLTLEPKPDHFSRDPKQVPSTSNVALILGKYKNDQPYIASVRPDPVFGLRVDYLSILLQSHGPLIASSKTIRGVSIREFVPNSPAATKFKVLGDNPAGWIISHVNGTPVATPAEFYAATKGQAKVKLTLRDWNEHSRELTLP